MLPAPQSCVQWRDILLAIRGHSCSTVDASDAQESLLAAVAIWAARALAALQCLWRSLLCQCGLQLQMDRERDG